MIHLIEAGHSYKVYGLKGALWISIDKAYQAFVKKHKVIFFIVEGNPVPYFIDKITADESWLVTLRDVTNPEDAAILSNQTIYVDQSRIKNVSDTMPTEEDIEPSWIGYLLMDETSGQSGIIQAIEEFPQQLMAVILYQDKEHYILLREEWITEVDDSKKTIHMQLPDGMFEL